LAMIPLIIALARFGGIKAVAVFCISLWLVASFGVIDPPAEPWSDRPWFFNPFSWQLIFFTGFCFGLGLLKAPPIEPRLVILALVIVVISIPFAYYRVYNLEGYEFLKEIRGHIGYFYNKTHFGLFRYLHFLALAYLAYSLAGEGGRRLMYGGLYGKCVSVVRKVGQQSLAVFLTSMFIARLAGVMFDAFGKSELMMVLVNGTGFAILIATAYTVAWFKSQPWRKPAPVAKHKAQPEQTGPPSSPSLAEQRA
ncbi:MAG: OpgC domain-containing protein, partial [Rhodospirillaceae bacterium]